MEITEETAEYMRYLPELYESTLKEFDGQYVFGKTLEQRIEKRYLENKLNRKNKFGISDKGLVKVPVQWLQENGFLASPSR